MIHDMLDEKTKLAIQSGLIWRGKHEVAHSFVLLSRGVGFIWGETSEVSVQLCSLPFQLYIQTVDTRLHTVVHPAAN